MNPVADCAIKHRLDIIAYIAGRWGMFRLDLVTTPGRLLVQCADANDAVFLKLKFSD